MTVDHAVRGEESLRLPWRLELLHLPFSPPRRPPRVLSAVVEIATGPVPDIRHDRALRCAVAAQAVGDQAAWLVCRPRSSRLKKRLAASASRRPWTRMSSTTPCWSTARQR